MKADIEGDGIRIKLEVIPVPGSGYEDEPYHFDLMRRAIASLIESYDSSHAEKVNAEDGDFFRASVLRAIARHYMLDDVSGIETTTTVENALAELLGYLCMNGYLQETVTNKPDDAAW